METVALSGDAKCNCNWQIANPKQGPAIGSCKASFAKAHEITPFFHLLGFPGRLVSFLLCCDGKTFRSLQAARASEIGCQPCRPSD
jgi:hypothetical protein